MCKDAEKKIYLHSTGDKEVSWKDGVPKQQRGWRNKLSGGREEIFFYGGEWGWLSDDERFEARQNWPRTAP